MKLGKVLQKYIPAKVFRKISSVYVRMKFSGASYACPLCGGSYKDFFPAGFDFPVLKELDIVGGGYREHVRCPGCNSSDRDRLFFLYLRDVLNVEIQKLHILHVAPEEKIQRYLKSLKNIEHESIDIGSKIADKKMDIQHIDYPDATFDVVLCNHVLEHIVDDQKAIRELYRVLKVGGIAILQVPISMKLEKTYEDFTIVSPKDRETFFGQDDHVRVYARDYKDRLIAGGFSVKVVPYAHEIGEDLAQKYSLNLREALYVCTKGSPDVSV